MSFEFWTADFNEFKQKVAIFGPLEKLATEAPDLFAHQVLCHGFMEYQGVTGLITKIKKQILTETLGAGNNSYEPYRKELEQEELSVELHHKIYEEHPQRIDELLKKEYLVWVKQNKLDYLPKELIEQGWEEYQND